MSQARKMPHGRVILSCALSGILLSGCLPPKTSSIKADTTKAGRSTSSAAATSSVNDDDSDRQAAAQKIQALMQLVEARFEEAKEINLAFYSPQNFQRAAIEIKLLQDLYKEYDPKATGFLGFGGAKSAEEDLNEQAAKTLGLIDKGLQNQALVETHLEKLMVDKVYLDPLKKYRFQGEYDAISNDINTLIRNMERYEKFDGLEADRDRISKKLFLHEVHITKAAILDGDGLLKSLRAIRSERVPKSYKQAKDDLRALEAFIEQTPRDSDGIETRRLRATRSIQRAASVQKEVDWVRKQPLTQTEQVVLRYHDSLSQLAAARQVDGFVQLPFNERIQALQQALAKRQTEQELELSQTLDADKQALLDEQKRQAVATALKEQQQKHKDEIAQLKQEHKQTSLLQQQTHGYQIMQLQQQLDRKAAPSTVAQPAMPPAAPAQASALPTIPIAAQQPVGQPAAEEAMRQQALEQARQQLAEEQARNTLIQQQATQQAQEEQLRQQALKEARQQLAAEQAAKQAQADRLRQQALEQARQQLAAEETAKQAQADRLRQQALEQARQQLAAEETAKQAQADRLRQQALADARKLLADEQAAQAKVEQEQQRQLALEQARKLLAEEANKQ